MGMVAYLHLVAPSELVGLLGVPATIHDVLARAYESGDVERTVDLDKAWHCLHFLLSGTAWEGEPPLGFLVNGGTSIGDEDVGYGPARAFSPTEVASIASALGALTLADLVARFDGPRMDALEIYPPGGWEGLEPSDPEEFGYFTQAFEEAKALTARGRDEGMAMLVWLT